jgi:hypothetical protein
MGHFATDHDPALRRLRVCQKPPVEKQVFVRERGERLTQLGGGVVAGSQVAATASFCACITCLPRPTVMMSAATVYERLVQFAHKLSWVRASYRLIV